MAKSFWISLIFLSTALQAQILKLPFSGSDDSDPMGKKWELLEKSNPKEDSEFLSKFQSLEKENQGVIDLESEKCQSNKECFKTLREEKKKLIERSVEAKKRYLIYLHEHQLEQIDAQKQSALKVLDQVR